MPTPTTGSQASYKGFSNVTHVDALLEGHRWGASSGAVTVSYSLPPSLSWWTTDYQDQASEPFVGFAPLNATQQAAFRSALAAWSEVANISFVETSDTSTNVGDIRIAFSRALSLDAGAWAYYPVNQNPIAGDIWLNGNYATSFTNVDPGSYGYQTVLHELGHAIGLKHPFDAGGGSGVTLVGVENTTQYTVMAYDDHPYAQIYPYQPALYDVAALQWLYGANMATRAGADRYAFSTGSEEVRTIWDAGGTDSFDVSSHTRAVAIDLRAGAFSSIGVRSDGSAATHNVAIAYDVTIENATGGAGSDSIIGNDAANTIDGQSGNDQITGLSGDDIVFGVAGSDVLYGNVGLDVIYGGTGDDWIYGGQNAGVLSPGLLNVMAYRDGIEYAYGGAGNDLIYGNHGSDVISGDADADTVYGGQESDTIDGGAGNDHLLGDLGDDRLTGGSGADRFHIKHGADTITDFSAAEGDTLSADGTRISVTDTAAGVVVAFSDGSQATLAGITSASLTGDWFVVTTPPPPATDIAADTGTTASVAPGSSASSTLDPAGDHDWFAVALTAGQRYTIAVGGSSGGGGTLGDPLVRLRNSAGTLLASDDDSGPGLDAQLAYTATYTGTHFIDVGAYADASTGTYTVTVAFVTGSPAEPPTAADPDAKVGLVGLSTALPAEGWLF